MMRRPFATFFGAATRLREGPYQYQASLARGRRLPDILAVPTGCGKTAAAILGWAWRRRECPDPEIQRKTPRRLIYCLPMRSLVEQVHKEVIRWFANLGWVKGHPSATAPYRPNWSADCVPVFRLMGGEEAAEWEGHPEREAVLVGTQDMLLSRALNRGYAMKPHYWPIAFGLVNVDVLWILDEVQLMGVGRTTSVQLHEFRHSQRHLRRESLWMSATIGVDNPMSEGGGQRFTQRAPDWMRTPEHGKSHVSVLRLGGADRRRMSKVLNGPKHVKCEEFTIDDASLPAQLLRHASGGRLVLVMVNRVERAQQLFKKVNKLVAHEDSGPEILLLHSRFRPRERSRAMDRLMATVPDDGRIVISTQVLEAGVDVDAAVLMTEICPWPSLVQRLGRLNRRGKKRGAVHILEVPVREPNEGWPRKRAKKKRQEAIARAQNEAALPYEWCDLEEAWKRVARLHGNASISAIERVDQAEPYRIPVAGQVLRKHHLYDLFDTDPDLSGGHLDVSRFVRSDEADLDVAVIWRALGLDGDSVSPEEILVPHPDEICRVPIVDLPKMGSGKRGWLLGLQRSRRRRGAWRAIRFGDLRPGDTVMLNVSVGGYDESLGWVRVEECQPSCWVSTVDGHRCWVRRDGTVIGQIDDRKEMWAGREGDPRSYARRWMELEKHLSKAEHEARQLAANLVPELADELATAGRWHDIGKALERDGTEGTVSPFQKMLREAGSYEPPHPRDAVYYAKSNGYGGPSCKFRHEVASTLAYLTEKDADDLIAWLVMAHHGKVRMTPMPWRDRRMDDVAGVRLGDRVPAGAVVLVGREEACDLDPDMLLPARCHPGWQGRIVKLLEEHGPQYLAYLETLVRVADWRAGR